MGQAAGGLEPAPRRGAGATLAAGAGAGGFAELARNGGSTHVQSVLFPSEVSHAWLMMGPHLTLSSKQPQQLGV